MGIKSKIVVAEMFDTINVQGKKGAFTIKNFAALSPRLVSAYTGMRGASKSAMRELGAVAQVIRQGTGSSEQAATAFEALLRVMTDAEKLKKLSSRGIQVYDLEELKKGKELMRPANDIMKELVKATGGRKTLLSSIFDAEAIRAFSSMLSEFNRTGKFESLDSFMNVKADGSVTRADSARASKDSVAGVESMSTAFKRLVSDNLTKPIGDLFGAVDGAGADNLVKAGVGIAATVGALYAGRKLFKGGQRLLNFFKGKKGGGVAGAALSAVGGVTPVFVVNMGLGGFGKGGKGRFGKFARGAGRARGAISGVLSGAGAAAGAGRFGAAKAIAGRAGLVGAAGAVGYGVGTIIYNQIDDTKFADSIGSAIAKTLAFFGNDDAQAAIDSRAKYEASLEVTVTDDRVKVSKLNADSELSVDVDAGNMMMAL